MLSSEIPIRTMLLVPLVVMLTEHVEEEELHEAVLCPSTGPDALATLGEMFGECRGIIEKRDGRDRKMKIRSSSFLFKRVRLLIFTFHHFLVAELDRDWIGRSWLHQVAVVSTAFICRRMRRPH